MSDLLGSSRPPRWLPLAAVLLVAACGNDLTLPPATVPIAQQQINLYAVNGTPVNTPSGYDMLTLAAVRTDASNSFDFVFDIGIDSAYGLGTAGDTVAVLLPRGTVGFVDDGGLQLSTLPFDSIAIAPTAGYVANQPTRIRVGDVVLAASRAQTCNFGFIRPRYAKLQVQAIDLVQRTVALLVIIDPNCGYRSLTSGVPTQ